MDQHIVARLAAEDLGNPIPIQWALLVWGATLGWVMLDGGDPPPRKPRG